MSFLDELLDDSNILDDVIEESVRGSIRFTVARGAMVTICRDGQEATAPTPFAFLLAYEDVVGIEPPPLPGLAGRVEFSKGGFTFTISTDEVEYEMVH